MKEGKRYLLYKNKTIVEVECLEVSKFAYKLLEELDDTK